VSPGYPNLTLIREQAAHSRRPPLAPRDLATLLGRAGVPDFADEILRLMATPLTAPDTDVGAAASEDQGSYPPS
jgi:hypothetical protein